MKKIIIGLIFILILFSLVGNSSYTEKFKSGYINRTKYAGIHINEIKEEKVMNSSGEEIGKRGEVTYDPDKITNESLSNFYNDKIKYSGYSYYTLVNEKDKTQGIISLACVSTLTYAQIDDNRYIVRAEKDFEVN
jgi:hypothetical protein